MDNTISQPMQTFTKAFLECIRTGTFQHQDTDAESVLEFLFIAYADAQGRDPEEITQGYTALNDHLEGVVSLEENNEIFSIVCGLCTACEKRAFIDAIQIGANLMLELQGN